MPDSDWERSWAKHVIGFYWTLPVVWAKFRSLPRDANKAAKRSKTIRYQREVVQGWARSEHVSIAAEIVCIEAEPDRASNRCLKIITKHLNGLEFSDVELVYVDFAEIDGSRYNRHIMRDLQEAGMTLNALSPYRILIDGLWFDPIAHFRDWREVHENARLERRERATTALREALAQFPQGYRRWPAIAEHLNARGIMTVTGLQWTSDTVKKAAAKVMLDA